MKKSEKFNIIEKKELKNINGGGFLSAAYEYLFSNSMDIVKKMGKRQPYYDHLYKDFK
ncbi:bacteriocin [Companilactobacillus futsaii]|uniref:Bacteriocin n=2 Tax=Companilactobacillus futsaii TaxID=938155 RepID=A0A5B7T1G7_9LACO|nr:bacteriocin [Companilactobacillus futsaii]KRK97704.1 hypothetical protein FC88_GL001497 [Companilactobacillus futsaii JCM 17355]QCX25658.1 bacteriocin [Companilactobacillus futsaii]